MSDERVISELSQGVLTIWLNNPDKLNALTYPMYDEIGRLVEQAAQDASCRAIVLRGKGRAFSAGFDLAHQVADSDVESKIDRLRSGSNRVRWAIWNSPKPVVAAVHGYCLAGAFELVLPADFTIAAESCELGEPEIQFGDGAAFLMVPWMMNHKQAKEVLLLGDRFDATEAHRIGLVSEVVADERFDERVHEVADRLRKLPSGALRVTKQGINRVYETAGMVAHMDSWVDTVVHLSSFEDEVTREFKRQVETNGPKRAAAWRAEYYQPTPRVPRSAQP
ncbi:enoyl-CoA hydratase/isomerase family protein [Saccharopolyspora oryzae]|uniref:Enoyl-CoA hydratase/isomerase family protein n=1 Tax=Saccharopolyspora oryzae TaxID=2997343 RepID=A0ABT4UXC4_9PSEU|nr:enoyl-CoA hydratase/isomerase family protein [Saccharopolyspora oryzae]MDA3626347.1 enoyl-CoA hydratase/isomerase family protein [Saccharopolyspora oryzae]